MIRFLPVATILASVVFARPAAAQLLPIPDKLIVLSFDDGNVSDHAFVAPLLKRHALWSNFLCDFRQRLARHS